MVEITRKKRFVFNPDEETKEMLVATFAIRKDIFKKIFNIIKSSSRDTAPQHFLLIGQRGMGKTTLLLRLKYEMEDDPELKHYLLPVRFSEEQYQIGCLPDLWEETALYLEGIDPYFKGLKDEMLKYEKEKDYERICFDILIKKLKEENKRVVLLIDNIGDLFNKLTDKETHRFREILMTCPQILLIGASSHMLEHTFKYDKPFFEFFYQIKLEPVKKEEATSLMKALADNYHVYSKIDKILKESPERIEVLRRITGGVPRTLVLLFEILVDSADGEAFEDLEELTDRVSPLYKERMDMLKPQQQKIMDALARAWEPISASAVLEQSKLYRENLASNQISAQLKQLEENQLVETIDLGKRKKAYRIRERFFNIWYLMRHGRKNTKEQVLWLVRFLESWCTLEELKDIARQQIGYLQKDGYSAKAAFYKAVALHAVKEIEPDIKKQLLEHTETFLGKTQKTEWAKTIHDLAEELKGFSYLTRAVEAYENSDLTQAEELLLDGISHNEQDAELNIALFYNDVLENFDKAEQYYLKAIDKGNVEALFNLALLYKNDKKDIGKAEQYYLKAIDEGHVNALNNLANIYVTEFKNFDKAEQYYLKAIDKGNVTAMSNIALLYNGKKDFAKAEQYYLKAIDKGNVDALFNLALLYQNDKKDIDRAEQYYKKASDKGDVDALFNLALLYQNAKKDIDKAEQYYLEASDKGDVDALFNLALLYQNAKKDIDKAEQYYLKAIDKGDVNALNNLAFLYQNDKKDIDRAEQYYLKAIDKGDVNALFNLALLYQNDKKDIDKAEQYYLKAIDKGDVDALFNVALLYESKKDIDKAEQYYKKALKTGNYMAMHNHIDLLLKKKKLNKVLEFAEQLFRNELYFTDTMKPALELTLELISLNQYHFLLKEFKKENSYLNKFLHPTWYVLAWYMKEDLPGEYEKAGQEIKETVDEMIKTVEGIRKERMNEAELA